MIRVLIKAQQVVVCTILVLLLFPCMVCAASLESVVEDMVEELNETIQLQGATVQLAPDSFLHANSKRKLKLSQALYNSLSSALSDAGTKVSLQMIGDEPICLKGVYDVGPGQIIMTIRLREMGSEASRDLAVVEAQVDRNDIAEELVIDNLGLAAESLVRQLESQVIIRHQSNFQGAVATPAGSNRPTLRLGMALQQAIKDAMAGSELFGAVSFGGNIQVVQMVPEYTVNHGEVVLFLHLEEGGQKYAVQTTLATQQVNSELLYVYDDRGVNTCVEVVATGRRDVKPGSRRVNELIQVLKNKLLAEHNIHVGGCRAGFEGRKITLSMSKTVKETPDGYGFINARLTGEVVGKKGALLGTANTTVRVTRNEDRANSRVLINKLLSEKIITELATATLIYP